MNNIEIISKKNCGPCVALKQFISSLDETCQSKFSIIDESTSTKEEIFNKLEELGSHGFPTIILKDDNEINRIITGFGMQTINILKNHIEC